MKSLGDAVRRTTLMVLQTVATLAPMICEARSNSVEEAAIRGGITGIVLAIAAGFIGFIKKQSADAASVEASKSELARAAANGRLKRVIALVQAGADVNAQDERGGTALMLAARNNRLPVVQYLLQHGAKTDLRTKSGVSAFDIAMRHASHHIIDAIALRALK